jgi:hypothetical protein
MTMEFLACLATLAAAPAPHPVLLAEGAGLTVALSDTTVLYADEQGSFFTVSIPSGEKSAWQPSWRPDEDGWQIRRGSYGDGMVFALSVSPDRGHVVYAQGVWLPDRYDVPEAAEAIRGCFVVVVCDTDGRHAFPAALGIEVGGGPEYDFTSDSRLLVGQPFFPCPPTPEGYAEYLELGWDNPRIAEFNCVDIATGEHGVIPDLNVGDGYWKCPFSDYFRIENNWYEEHEFSSFQTGGLLGSYSVPEGSSGGILGWILPDAVLLEGDGEHREVLFVDGRALEGPASSWDFFCRMPDGTSVFTMDGGRTVMHGTVDWTTGSVSGAVPCPGLEDCLESSFIPLPGSGGVLLHSPAPWGTGLLYFYDLP